eukprot:INCI13097.2.p1 GENE.INCI13097.2~~INCI13097.2.p1  ORF type:complete len:710 (+),score=94.52 INCI13097.2:474-2603(+)
MADSVKVSADAAARDTRQAFWLNRLHTEPPAPPPPPGLQTRCIPSLLREVPPDTTRVWLMNFKVSPLLLREIAPVMFTLPLTVFHGEDLEREDWMPSHMHLIRPKTPYMGTHHTKGMLFFTPRGLRLCIHTANYVPGDLFLKTQGVWLQDFPRKAQTAPASSTFASAATAASAEACDFETALVNYFSHCCRGHENRCGDPRTLLSAFDFRGARGALVSSVPGLRAGFQRSHFGHHRIRALLQREAALERTLPSHRRRPISTANQEDWPIVCQYSSCGSLASNWVRAELLKSMGAKHSTKVYHVVPSVEQVRLSIEGYSGGDSIPIASKNVFVQATTHQKKRPFGSRCQGAFAADSTRASTIVPALHDPPASTMCRWGGRPMQKRTRGSLPHIKTYCRFRPKVSGGKVSSLAAHPPTELAWVLLTSSNLSKAAHGFTMSKDVEGGKQKILSWELGVLLFPRHFVPSSDSSRDFSLATTNSFPGTRQRCPVPANTNAVLVAADGHRENATARNNSHVMVVCPLPYELPPVPYTTNDELWTVDTPHIVPDLHGRVVCDDPNMLLALKRQRQSQQSRAGSWGKPASTIPVREQPAAAPAGLSTAPHAIELHLDNEGECVASSKFAGVGRKLGGSHTSDSSIASSGRRSVATHKDRQRKADQGTGSSPHLQVARDCISATAKGPRLLVQPSSDHAQAEERVVIDLLSSSDEEPV